jgi:hypothetical protein
MFGVASHFNRDGRFIVAMYALMGLLAVILTSASLVMGVLIWRNRASGLPDAVRLSLGLGLILTFVLTVIVAATMAQGPGHLVGIAETGAAVPVFGWSREVGDLRVSHFLATHALHGLPLVGVAAAWLLPTGPARVAIWIGGAVYAGLVSLTFAQALSGNPFLT